MKTPRIILWDELPGVINQEHPASWKESPLAADGYQSKAKARSAPVQAFFFFRDQAPCEN